MESLIQGAVEHRVNLLDAPRRQSRSEQATYAV
jgi:hypothetical protein